MHHQILFFLLFFLAMAGCETETPVPKPRAYPRVVYPLKEFQGFQTDFCDFTCEIPKYATIARDTTFFDEKPKDDCWFNLEVKELNAKVYCSYYPIRSTKDFDKLVGDAFEMVNKHNIKASSINQQLVDRPEAKVHGIIFDIEGPVATTYQFFVTDSTRHFLRGALYFETHARPDSLAPVVNFMKDDINHMVSTLQWK